MSTSFGALCSEFYVNQKLSLKMDIPRDRETVLHLFDRVRKSIPSMERFRRYDDELALETPRRDPEYRWLALRRTSVRTGHINPQGTEESHQLHRLMLEIAPYHLTISPLDIDYMELMFGFDLECKANHDEVVYEALLANSGLANLLNVPGSKVLDVQPSFGLTLNQRGDLQACFEVKTRTKGRRGQRIGRRDEPISIFLTIRHYGPVQHIKLLMERHEELYQKAEELAAEYVVPNLLTPIARQIVSSSA